MGNRTGGHGDAHCLAWNKHGIRKRCCSDFKLEAEVVLLETDVVEEETEPKQGEPSWRDKDVTFC